MMRSFLHGVVACTAILLLAGRCSEEKAPIATRSETIDSIPAAAASAAPAAQSPHAIVTGLYAKHSKGENPFFQTKQRAWLDEFFDKSLADLAWNDAVASNGEVGALGFDPLYDVQDLEITNFKVGPAEIAASGLSARVTVTFANIGKSRQLVYLLAKADDQWRITDIDFGEGRTLRKTFVSSN